MKENTDKKRDSRDKTPNPRPGFGFRSLESGEWYRSTVATAVVCAVFSLIILALIVNNYIQGRINDTKQETQLENLKIELHKHPDNEQLISRIRQLDLQIRQHIIRRLDFSRKGSYLLLGSVAIFFICLKYADTFKKRVPSLQEPGDQGSKQVRQATLSRRAVIAGSAVLGLGAFLFLAIPQDTLRWSDDIDFAGTDEAITPYPSMEQISKNWPSFRGPGGLGISAYSNVPADWNGKTGDGILWKTKVPLPGNSSPVIWGDRVFLSGGDPNELQVFCFDTVSGRLLWTGDVARAPLKNDEEPLEVMEDTGFAAPTVVTDGRRVYAIFATGDVGCFDFDGKSIWTRSLGIPDSAYGYASSLAMYRNLVLIQYDEGGPDDEMSRLIALDGFTSQTVWETKRPVPNSWSSPIITEIDGQFQLLTCGDPWVIAYEPAKGTELWRVNCLYGDIAPSPVYANGLVFAIEPYSKLAAIRPDGQGDVTETHIAWSIEDGTPDICSPVSNGELIFLLSTEGLLCCYKTTDGTKLWEKDLMDDFLASPSLVGNNVYLLSEKGVMYIIEAGTEYKELTRCELGEHCYASPAFADGRIYVRGIENLYCIGQTQRTEDRKQRTDSDF